MICPQPPLSAILRSIGLTAVIGISCLMLACMPLQGASFDGLLAKVPPSANTLVLIDVDNTLATPLAKEQGWAKKLEAAYVERPVYLPPEARKLVLSSTLSPSRNFLPLWELAVMELAEPMSIRAVARAEGGYTDTVNGLPTAWSPGNAYFVSFDPNTLGVVVPAERQFVSRWIDFARDNRQPELTDYLQSISGKITQRIQVVMAMDLHDVVRPHVLAGKLKNSEALKPARDRLEQIEKIVASLRGAMLRVAIDKTASGQLEIEFGEDVAPLKSIAKPLVLEALRDMEAEVADLESWKVQLRGNVIDLRGPLSADALRKVFSVLELPAVHLGESKGRPDREAGAKAEPPSSSEIREKSLTYFSSIQVMLKDLRKGLKKTRATSSWTERYARRIDNLPILHVDDELLEYGAYLTENLRAMALAKRSAGISAGVRTAGDYGRFNYSTSYGYGYGYGYGRSRTGNDSQASTLNRARISKEEMAEASNARVEGWKSIDDATADIRRRMTKKYDTEF